MKSLPLILGVAVYMAAIMFGARYFLGQSTGPWIGVAILGVTYLALKIYTDREERLLREDLERMTPDQQQEFIRAAKDKGLLGGAKDG
jgi:hypothetical protein